MWLLGYRFHLSSSTFLRLPLTCFLRCNFGLRLSIRCFDLFNISFLEEERVSRLFLLARSFLRFNDVVDYDQSIVEIKSQVGVLSQQLSYHLLEVNIDF